MENTSSKIRKIVYAAITGITFIMLSYTGYNPLSLLLQLLALIGVESFGLAFILLIVGPTINLIIGIFLGLYVEKVSRLSPYWARGIYFGILFSIVMAVSETLQSLEVKTSVTPSVIVVLIVSIIVSVLFGKMRNRNIVKV
jgi:hypothetical protein